MIRCLSVRKRPLLLICLLSLPLGPGGGFASTAAPPTVAIASWPASLSNRPPQALTLEACVFMAIDRDYDIRLEALAAAQAEADLLGERGRFEPRVFGRAGRRESEEEGADPDRTDRGELGVRSLLLTGTDLSLSSTFSDFNAAASNDRGRVVARLTQPLLRDAGVRVTRAGVLRARRNREIARLQLAARVMDSILSVENQYWSLVAARERLRVQQESLEFAEELAETTRLKVEAGMMAESDIVEAEAAVSSRRTRVVRARERVRTIEDGLKERLALLNNPASWTTSLEPVTEPARTGGTPSFLQVLRTALLRRPDIRQERMRLENAELGLDVAENSLLPRLDLVADAAREATGDGTGALGDAFGDAPEESWSVFLEFEVPLGNREARARRDRAAAETDSRLVRLQRLELRIVRELRRAVDAVNTAREVVETTAREVELEQLKLDNERAKLELGTSTTDNVVRFIQSLNNARLGRVQALTDYNQALAELERLQGTTLETYGVTLDDVQ